MKFAPYSSVLVRCLFVLCLAISGHFHAGHSSAADKPPHEAQAEQIKVLIKQLGHDKYVLREHAQTELKRIGPPALDALTSALTSDDIEVVMRARYLLTAIQIEWAKDTDPPKIREMMNDYSSRSEKIRRAKINELARIAGDPGVEVLCRIVRYEKSAVLAKWAAILVMEMDTEDAKRPERAQLVISQLGNSQRRGAHWLRTFAKHREDDNDTIAVWQRLTQEEQRLWEEASEWTSYEILQKMYFRLVALLESANRRQEVEPYLQQIVALQPDDEKSVRTLVGWLVDKDVPRVIETVAEKFPDIFNEETFLLYTLAHAQLSLGKQDQAEATVERARNRDISSTARVDVADQLRKRGWFDWAESEYRIIIRTDEWKTGAPVYSLIRMKEMLHDQQQERKAADAAQQLVKKMDANPNVLAWVRELGRDPKSIRSRMHFFYALHFEIEGDAKKHREHLKFAVGADPNDADVLIALYRLPNQSAAERGYIAVKIQRSINAFRNQIAAAPDSANAYNQFAWLVGNTVGETDDGLAKQAIEYSHKSLELEPRAAGYLDTLGRCYYANGDLVNAVKYQTAAAERDPHSGLIRRQLELFEKALAAKQENEST